MEEDFMKTLLGLQKEEIKISIRNRTVEEIKSILYTPDSLIGWMGNIDEWCF